MAPDLQTGLRYPHRLRKKLPPQKEQEANTAEIEEVQALDEVEASKAVDSGSWQVECCELNTRLGTMLDRGLWTDCVLLVGKEDVRFVAHRALLAGASPVCAAMLYGSRAPSSLEVPFRLPNVEPETFKLVLEYIYTDQTLIKSCEMACMIYKAAEYFFMPHLKSKSKTYLINNVSPVTVLHVFEFGQMYEDIELKEKCLEIITEKTEAVLEGPGLEVVSVHTLEKLFALPELDISSELELVKAADRWVRAQPRIKPLEDVGLSEHSVNDLSKSDIKPDIDENDPKVLIRKALQQIRFLTINAKKFVEYDTTHLLDESDMLALSFNIQSRKSFVPLPKDFCTSMERRTKKQLFTISLKKMSKFMDEIKVAKTSIKYSNRFYISRILPWFFQLIYIREKLYWSILIVDPNWKTYNKVLWKAYITVRFLRHQQYGSPLELDIAKIKYEKLKASTTGRDDCSNLAAIPQLSLIDLMDPRNGYLQKDAVTIEIKIVNEILQFDSVDITIDSNHNQKQ